MEPLKPTGFWSYTSIDDSASGGRLSQLRKLLADELQPQVGRSRVHIFQDVAAIPPGKDWEREIDDALEQASFLIPILTPGFLQSEWCCKEVTRFRAIMERWGRNDLILPVHYLDVDAFETVRRGECYDPEVYRFLRTLQWTDFRPIRLLEPSSLQVRQKLETVAQGILGALYRQVASAPVEVAPAADPEPVAVAAIEVPPPPTATVAATEVPPQSPAEPPKAPIVMAGCDPPSMPSQRWNVRRWVLILAGLALLIDVGWHTVIRTVPSPAVIPTVPVARTPSPPPPPPAPAKELRDCPTCPEMVLIPAGSFTMGVPEAESPPENWDDSASRPLHRVTIAGPFHMSKFAVTRAEYAVFIADAGPRPAGDPCDWRNPGFEQTDRHPVVCVGADDAEAYAVWLSGKTKQSYRLPSEAEWEYAARAGTKTARYWGDAIGANQANCNHCGSAWDNKSTAPSGSFPANAFGLYEMLGNAWQWTSDCWNGNYVGAPSDGSAWKTGACSGRVMRGGSWNYFPRGVRVGARLYNVRGVPSNSIGFRLSRTL